MAKDFRVTLKILIKMKNLFISIALIIAISVTAQTSWSKTDYSNETYPNELQITIVPLSKSSDQELNQIDISWRRGFWSFGGRYGLDSDRTNYFDINAGFYFYINPYVDLTLNGGYGVRNPKIWVPDDYKKQIIPLSFGIIGKPIRQLQLSITAQKIVPDNIWYFQTGLMFLFKLSK